jgi:glucose repression regulatory protein TUP1
MHDHAAGFFCERSEHVCLALLRPQTRMSVDLLHSLDHSSVVCCVKFSSDGKFVATGCNKAAIIYDVHTGEKISSFMNDSLPDSQGDSYVRSVCFSPDSKLLVAGEYPSRCA